MESNGGVDESTRLLKELQSLKDSKRDIEARISALEGQLRQIQSNQQLNKKASSDCSNGGSEFGHDLTPDMIYRYSRQLLLPSFGVQGLFLLCLLGLTLSLDVCVQSATISKLVQKVVIKMIVFAPIDTPFAPCL